MNQQQKQLVNEDTSCFESPSYFARYVQIKDDRSWVPFDLWQEQVTTLEAIHGNKLTIILKARQLGLTWLCLTYGLWLMLFRPGSTVLLFSRRDNEAVELLKGKMHPTYGRLPAWMQIAVDKLSDRELRLANGDSYTAQFCLVDEADLVPNLNDLLLSAKPTIDSGGSKMALLSKANKSQPASTFKNLYRDAEAGESPWHPVFLPWFVCPARDQAWYEEQVRHSLAEDGSPDGLHESYPATVTEALAPRALDKRIPGDLLEKCYERRSSFSAGCSVPGFRVFSAPVDGRRYVLGVDPADGGPDASALAVMDVNSGEQVACLAGKIEAAPFAGYVYEIGHLYNDAAVLVERNNHGAAVILWLRDNSSLRLLLAADGKPGWLTTSKSKAQLFVEASTLRAPKGQHDDLAVVATGKSPQSLPPLKKPLRRAASRSLFGESQSKEDWSPDRSDITIELRAPRRLFR